MSRVVDYIIKYGDYSFSEFPLNQVDAAILTQLPLLDLSNVIDDKSNTTICDAFNLYLKLENDRERRESLLIYRRITNLFKHISERKRYKDILISDYVEIIENEEPCQFSAISFHIDDKILVCFGGTDDTIVGWHEDFLLLYSDQIPSHKHGLKYLNKITRKYDNEIILCGHSKGANISMNVTLRTSKKNFDRIVKVYCFDGPGINKNDIDNKVLKERINKITSYIPYRSSIGKLFDHYEEYKIVECSANLLFQHDISTWHIENYDFIYKEKESSESLYLENHVKAIISDMDDESRKVFVSALFNILYVSEITNYREALKSKGKIIRNVFKLKKEEKKLFNKLIFKGMLKDSKIRKMLISILKEKKQID